MGRLNSDSSSGNYATWYLEASGTSWNSSGFVKTTLSGGGFGASWATTDSGLFTQFNVEITDYTNTSKWKAWRSKAYTSRSGASLVTLDNTFGQWFNTNNITQIDLLSYGSGYTWATGTTLTLYGVN